MPELLTAASQKDCDHDWTNWVADEVFEEEDIRFCVLCGLEERRVG